MGGYRKAERGVAGLVWKESIQSLPRGSELVLALFSNIPNRSTFVCPYCGARNLDQQELVKHCMENHRNDPNKVVSDTGALGRAASVWCSSWKSKYTVADAAPEATSTQSCCCT